MSVQKTGRASFVRKWRLPLAGAALLLICMVTILLTATKYTTKIQSDEELTVTIENDCVRLVEQRTENGTCYLTFESVRRGKASVDVYAGDEPVVFFHLYVHSGGIITRETFFGPCRGSRVIPAAVIVFVLLALFLLIRKYRSDIRENLFQHKNVRNLGLIFYLSALLLTQVRYLFEDSGLENAIRTIISSTNLFAFFAFPVAFVAFLLVSLSNVQLMRKEGFTWRNMLGFFLGILLCFSTLFPNLLSNYLQFHQTAIDVHKESGIVLYIEMAVEETVFIVVTYLECILLSAIIHAVRAAKHIPAFDRDYMLILGCQIREDGTLTNLLKGRADRAIEFARMQEEKTGKKLTFVPSGGQGPDEVMSEAAAIRNYLLETGIPEERILLEDQSKNTYENLRNSAALIAEDMKKAPDEGSRDAKIAFSTTNYHVFRSGILATEQGIRVEGIGSRTKRYFWINAFIREFIANLYSERKVHIRLLVSMIFLMLCMIALVYISVLL